MNEMPTVWALTVAQWAELVRDGAVLSVRTRLDGTSMQPLIRRGRDVVTIAAVNRPLKCGDVVLFRRADGAYVVHRIRRLHGATITTLGDNCWNEDAPIRFEDVLGIAVQVQRGKRTIHLDNNLSRAGGQCWMACHGWRMGCRRVRSVIARCARRVIPWKKREGNTAQKKTCSKDEHMI